MGRTTHSRLDCFWHHDDFYHAVAAKVILIHLRQVSGENQMIIRFENGYGVTLRPVLIEGDEEVFELLVLKFYGVGILDYKVTQYAPIPELNRGNFDEIISLCKRVSLLPNSKARKVSSGQSIIKGKKGELERRCCNF